jgi:hypothetical protein
MMSSSINCNKNLKPIFLRSNAKVAVHHTIEIVLGIRHLHRGVDDRVVLCSNYLDQSGENQSPNEQCSFAVFDHEQKFIA